jgi:hypothetical protein
MQIQFAAVPKDRLGEDFTEPDIARKVPGQTPAMKKITLGALCCAVLDMAFPDEQHEGLKPKLRRAELMDKITAAENAAAPLDLLDADVDMLKERLAKRNFPTGLTVAAVRLLESPAAV